ANRLGNAFKKIDYRCTAKLKRVCVHTLFESNEPVRLIGSFQRNQDLEGAAEHASVQLVETDKIEEQKLFRKAEVLLKQSITQEATIRVRKYAVLHTETYLLQVARRKNRRRSSVPSRGWPQYGAHGIQEQKLIKRVDGGGLSIKVEPQRANRQFSKAKTTQAL